MQLQGRNLEIGLQGADVRLLQFELQLVDMPAPEEEVRQNRFDAGTRKAVAHFQEKFRLNPTGIVDPATAKQINLMVREYVSPPQVLERLAETVKITLEQVFGLDAATPNLRREIERLGDTLQAMVITLDEVRELDVDQEQVKEVEAMLQEGRDRLQQLLEELNGQPAAPQSFVVSGQVRREDGLPFKGGLVRAFHETERGTIRLGEDTTDPEGGYTIRYQLLPETDSINLYVTVSDASGKLLKRSETTYKARSLEVVDVVVSSIDVATYQVTGKVASRAAAGVAGLRVQIVDKGVGKDVPLVVVETDENGAYLAEFTDDNVRRRGKLRPDLQARVSTGDQFLGASDVRYDASTRETLNIRLDDKANAALRSEHETLTASLAGHFTGNLGDLKETDDQQDITYLANKTGWDARAVALAALADQFSARTQATNDDIEPALFYALFRAGLPANEDALYQTDASTAQTIWQKSVDQGLISSGLKDKIPQAVERFQNLAAQHTLDRPALAGVSSLKEMLAISLGDDAQRQKRFADLYTRHRSNLPAFWEAVRDEFDEPTEKRLRLDGQLAYLTLNNAPLIRKLRTVGGQNEINDPLQLVEGGYFRAENWQEAIGDDPVPPEITGPNDAEKRRRYAELLAAQVRLSYPTAVVAQMVKSGETPVATAGLADSVSGFLTEHQGKFEIGMQPVEQYIVRNNMQIAPEVTTAITRIQRVYQITPSDEAMNALLKKDVDSAYAVVRYDRDEFVQAFKDEVGGEEQAALIYAKSQQVHNVALNLAVSYLNTKNAPGIGARSSPPAYVAPEPNPNAADVIAYPTLEGLFGEFDFCACEHCRSILSPAAYLVDLLLFCDRPTNEKENPQAVLLERRPDIQHLPLTCENTNTPLPYIDLVNETLEYFVTNNLSLVDYTGHDTDSSTRPEELLANPQFVSDQAYVTLAGKPAQVGDPLPLLPPAPPLPFHQPLENLRCYFDRFEAPLPEVMQALRKDDNLERAIANEYGWRDILMEELRLSRAEYALLSDRTITLQQLYGFPPATTDADVLAKLSNAKAFTRRVGLSYEDLVEILKARFVNPNATLIPKLERLGVSFATLKTLKESAETGQAWLDLLPQPVPDASHYGGNIENWVKDETNFANIMDLITLTDPTGSEDVCSFDKLQFRYADPDKIAEPIRAFEFVRLIRFIRLWQKLGWTIEQTDKAITALYPANQTPDDPNDAVNLQRLDAGCLVLLPRLGVVKRVLAALKLKPKKDLLSLLVCFAPMDTHGAVPLYRQMFLSPALLKQDPAFADDGFGNFLTDNTQKLTAHVEALRAAFLLTDAELSDIFAALEFDINTVLDITNISAVFRRGWLARKLKLSVREFLLLTEFTAIDPFAAPDPPDPPILHLLKVVNRLRAAPLKPVQALYLIWNQDISGKSAPENAEISGFARTLRGDFGAIETEFALADDPTGQIARARMALVFGNEATDLFFGLLERKVTTDVAYAHGQAVLEQPILDAAPGIAYDNLRKRLSYDAGVMPDATRDALKLVAGVTQAFKDAVDELHQKSRDFFDRYPKLLPFHDAYIASNDPVEKKRSDLLAKFLPELKRSRKRQQALQAISALANADVAFASNVLDNRLDNKYVLHAADDNAHPALDDLTALETPGLSAQFFFRDTASGAIDHASDAEANLAYAAAGSNKLPDNGGNPLSGIWSGYLEAPENGFYNIHIEVEADTTVTMSLAGATVALVQNGNLWTNNVPLELRAGTLYTISIKVEKVKDTVIVRWEATGRGREIIPARYLYSATLADHLRLVYIRFFKAASLAAALNLTPAETAYLASQADFQISGQGWLNSLPVAGSPDKATSGVLFKALAALLDFARIKADLAPDDERLLAVLKDPAAATQNPDSLLFTLARWELASLTALLTRFGQVVADLAHLETFVRVHEAMAWVNKLGVSASALIEAATNEPEATTVRDLQAVLRARYDESDWLKVLQPINDELRGLQRDALVAYILHQFRLNPATAHIDTPDKLFEYFLMDVQMEPCMQTSRIRHALSSVQLFIERCLMNLEPRVAPSSIKARQWQWMSRYRVWEANRKVFLWPENWLEPELRDDQSSFFKETMSELLQSDITEERAAIALLNYLAKLDEVAKLEPCGIYYVENDPGAADDVAHVVARTAGANRKYFYRRREPSGWTPWEQIKLDIEDNPVTPVVWNGRLFLFWLKILKQAPIDPEAMPTSSTSTQSLANLSLGAIKTDAKSSAKQSTKMTVQAVLCWSEFYNGKWQPARTSDVDRPLGLDQFDLVGPNAFDRSKLKLAALFYTKGAVRIIVSDGSGAGASFFLHNAYSLPELRDGKKESHFPPKRTMETTTSALKIGYPNSNVAHLVLDNAISDRTIEPNHPLAGNPWDAPFFYEDGRHVFYVTTSEHLVTVPSWDDFGIVVGPATMKVDIPGLVLEPVEVIPDLAGPIIKQPGFGTIDPSPIERYITEDAYIHRGIGTIGTVRFGDKEIGPAGS